MNVKWKGRANMAGEGFKSCGYPVGNCLLVDDSNARAERCTDGHCSPEERTLITTALESERCYQARVKAARLYTTRHRDKSYGADDRQRAEELYLEASRLFDNARTRFREACKVILDREDKNAKSPA